MQHVLFLEEDFRVSPSLKNKKETITIQPFKTQLLKWVGSKQRVAHEIIKYFPSNFNNYHEPFLGSGGVLGVLSPNKAFASDAFKPLMEIWIALKENPEKLKSWYSERWHQMMSGDKVSEYEKIKANYNNNPNGADFLFLCRSCYGGIVRFRKEDGYMSTPCGVHLPISPKSFWNRVDEWHHRVNGTVFEHIEFEEAMLKVKKGDIVYCDPPYSFTQSILYGAQSFSLERLFDIILECKTRGAYVALSIDGSKKSGNFLCDISLPDNLFEREIVISCGRSMLRRFQMEGKSLESEIVTDRLLLTY